MGASFLVSFREILELSLVIGMVSAFLSASGQRGLRSAVWSGLAAGMAASIGVAIVFVVVAGEFEGRGEQIFEGCVMAVGAALMIGLLFWLNKGATRGAIESKVQLAGQSATPWLGIFTLILVASLREGVEMVIFLATLPGTGGGWGIAGASLGILVAASLGLAMFAGQRKLPLKPFFAISNLLLVLFAAGLASMAAGEFAEAGILPALSPLVSLDGILPQDGLLGSLLRGLFGYSDAPTWLTFGFWLALLVFGLVMIEVKKRSYQKK